MRGKISFLCYLLIVLQDNDTVRLFEARAITFTYDVTPRTKAMYVSQIVTLLH